MAIIVTKLPIPSNEKGVPGGVATLDPVTGYIPLSQIDPSIGGQGDVLSVNNLDPDTNGNVDITTNDIPELNNLYYTQGRFDTAFSSAIIPTTQSVVDLNLALQAEVNERQGNDIAQSNRITALENDHVTIQMFNGLDSRLDQIEIDLPAEIQNRINDVEDLQSQITAEVAAREAADLAIDSRLDDVELHHIHSNSFYANDGVSDIQTEIDSVGTSQGQIVWISSGSFGGADVSINDKINMGLIGPDVGNTICELASGRGLSITGTSERIRIANLQIEGAFSITGTKGRHVFSDCEFLGGVTIDGVTDSSATFITFQDCTFENQNINLANLSNCIVYFNRCSFNNRRVLTTNCTTSPYNGIIAEGSLLNVLQTQFSGGIVLAGRNDYSNGVVKTYTTSANFVSALGVETSFSGSYTELLNKPTLVTAASQLSDYNTLLLTSMKGQANGVAELDANGLIPNHHIPPLALTKPYVVNTIAERDALTGINTGDVAIVTNDPTPANNGNYIYDADLPSWISLYNSVAPVDSVNGQTGTVTLYTGDVQEGVGANSEPSQLYFTNQRAIDAVVTSDIDTNDKAPSTQTVKSYVTGITDALDTRLDSIETDSATHATITYVDNALTGKVNTTDYTASDVLTKIKTVDGASSGLDADLLDGLNSDAFVQLLGTQTITGNKDFSGVVTVPTQANGDNSTKVANTAFVQDAISGFTSVDGIRTAVGLDSNDTWSLPSSHYLTGSSVITGALNTLDGQIHNANTINTAQNTSLGLASNGTKTDFGSTYYVTGNSSFKAAIEALDAGLNTVAGNTPTINNLSDISNVNVNEDAGDNGKFLKWNNTTSKWVADSVPAGYTDNNAKDTIGAMLEAGTGDVVFTYDELNRTISTQVSLYAGVESVNGDAGPAVVLDATDISATYTASNYTPAATHIKGHLQGIDSALLLKAGLTSNTFTGDNQYDAAYTLSLTDNSKKFATTKFVNDKLGSLTGALIYKGAYNATTGTPSLANSLIGDVYAVSVAGTLAGQSLLVGDLIIFKANVVGGTVQSTDFNVISQGVGVTSINSLTGDVILNGANINSAVSPTNYSIANAKIDSHLAGINTKLGTVPALSSNNTWTGTNTFSNTVDMSSAGTVNAPSAGADFATVDSKVVNRAYLIGYTTSQLLKKSNNLSDLTNVGTARANLNLGTAAIYNTGTASNTIPLLTASGLPAIGGSALTSLPGIDLHSDVTITSATSGQVLTFDGTNWVNQNSVSSAVRPTLIATASSAYVPAALSAGVAEVIFKITPIANATVTLTNISAVGNTGVKLTFKKMNSFYVQIIPKTGETIDGFSVGTDMMQSYASLTIVSDGANWLII